MEYKILCSFTNKIDFRNSNILNKCYRKESKVKVDKTTQKIERNPETVRMDFISDLFDPFFTEQFLN